MRGSTGLVLGSAAVLAVATGCSSRPAGVDASADAAASGMDGGVDGGDASAPSGRCTPDPAWTAGSLGDRSLVPVGETGTSADPLQFAEIGWNPLEGVLAEAADDSGARNTRIQALWSDIEGSGKGIYDQYYLDRLGNDIEAGGRRRTRIPVCVTRTPRSPSSGTTPIACSA